MLCKKKRKKPRSSFQRRRFDLATLSANKIIPTSQLIYHKTSITETQTRLLLFGSCCLPHPHFESLPLHTVHTTPSLSLLYIHLYSALFSCTFPPFFFPSNQSLVYLTWLWLPEEDRRQSFKSRPSGGTERRARRGPRFGPSLSSSRPRKGPSLLCIISPGMASSSTPTSWRSLFPLPKVSISEVMRGVKETVVF
jgi:hypothetical protein